MLKFSIKRIILNWLVSSIIAIIISFIKDLLNQNLKSIQSTFYNPYYKWTDFWFFFLIILLIISFSYFIIIFIFKKTFKSFVSREILAILLSFFVIPLIIPYNSLTNYLINISNFSILEEYLFEIMEIGIAGSFIPIIDKILFRNGIKNDK